MSKYAATVSNLTYTIQEAGKDRTILKNINYNFEPGKIYTISGPSGSGKTTFLYTIAGLLDQVQGSVKIGEREILQEKRQVRDQIRLNQIGMIFQNLNLFDFMNVEDNILISYYLRKQKVPITVHRQIAGYLEQMNLGQIQKKQISSLSGGEQHQVLSVANLIITLLC